MLKYPHFMSLTITVCLHRKHIIDSERLENINIIGDTKYGN